MTRHRDEIRLQHMLDHAREALSLAKGKTRADLGADRTLELALTRLLEIVGEAAARIPQSSRQRYAHIPWPEMIGLRNRLIHGYDAVDLDILWAIIQDDLPPVIASLQDILEEP